MKAGDRDFILFKNPHLSQISLPVYFVWNNLVKKMMSITDTVIQTFVKSCIRLSLTSLFFQSVFFFSSFSFLPDLPKDLHKMVGHGKQNILLGWLAYINGKQLFSRMLDE